MTFSDANRLPVRRGAENYRIDQIEIFKASTVPDLCTLLKSLPMKMKSAAGPLIMMKDGTSLSLFRDGIEPLWEDEWNRNVTFISLLYSSQLSSLYFAM